MLDFVGKGGSSTIVSLGSAAGNCTTVSVGAEAERFFGSPSAIVGLDAISASPFSVFSVDWSKGRNTFSGENGALLDSNLEIQLW